MTEATPLAQITDAMVDAFHTADLGPSEDWLCGCMGARTGRPACPCKLRATRIRLAAALSASPAPSGQGVSGEVPTGEQIARAIKATEYKYFGDYEMSDDQRDAVDVLVRVARHYANASPAPSCAPGEVERLMHVIDRNRYTAAACVNAVEFVLHTRRWLREAGRGSYAYDDERYQQEFGLAFDEIMEALRPMRAVAHDKTDCTTDPEKVQAARAAGADRFAALSPQGLDAKEGGE